MQSGYTEVMRGRSCDYQVIVMTRVRIVRLAKDRERRKKRREFF